MTTDAPKIIGQLGIDGSAGRTWQDVEIIEHLPKRIRIRAITDTRLAGQSRVLHADETALVPVHAIRLTPEAKRMRTLQLSQRHGVGH